MFICIRRGLKRTATIYSLSFSPCGLYLACSSNTETVHVFKMEETSPKETWVSCMYNVMWLFLSSVSISFKRRKWFLFLIYYSGTDAGNSSPPSGSGGSGFSPVGGSAGVAGEGSVAGITNNGDSSWMGYFSNVVSVSANYLPSQVTDTLMQGRAFATVHHNLYGFRNICALAM